jgi:cell division septation protein DedD
MNTIRLFSLITLLGLVTSQAVAMDNQALDAIFKEKMQALEKETQEALIDLIPVTAAEEITSAQPVTEAAKVASTWTETVKEVAKAALEKGQTVLAIPVNHPYYTAGAVAVIGGSWVVYKYGNIESIKKFVNNNKKALGMGLIGTTALVGSAYAANHYGYVPSMETVKGYMPSMPSMETVKGYMPSKETLSNAAFNWKTGTALGTLGIIGLGYYGLNQYNNKQLAPANEAYPNKEEKSPEVNPAPKKPVNAQPTATTGQQGSQANLKPVTKPTTTVTTTSKNPVVVNKGGMFSTSNVEEVKQNLVKALNANNKVEANNIVTALKEANCGDLTQLTNTFFTARNNEEFVSVINQMKNIQFKTVSDLKNSTRIKEDRRVKAVTTAYDNVVKALEQIK